MFVEPWTSSCVEFQRSGSLSKLINVGCVGPTPKIPWPGNFWSRARELVHVHIGVAGWRVNRERCGVSCALFFDDLLEPRQIGKGTSHRAALVRGHIAL